MTITQTHRFGRTIRQFTIAIILLGSSLAMNGNNCNPNMPPIAYPQPNVSVAFNTSTQITLSGSDPDGDALIYSILIQPSNGTLAALTGASTTYTPQANYAGPDSFTFSVNDGQFDSPPAMVTIAVATEPTVTNPTPEDLDGDGVRNNLDGCPTDPTKTAPGTCGCGTSDADSDSDGTLDCDDGCPNDRRKTFSGVCGCGTPDTDSDSDGILDCSDGCPQDPNKITPGTCGCGRPEGCPPPDATPPTQPDGVTATAASSWKIKLAWMPSSDSGGSGLAGYRVYRGGREIATTTGVSLTDFPPTDGTEYCYTIEAFDNAGNRSAQASPACATTPSAMVSLQGGQFQMGDHFDDSWGFPEKPLHPVSMSPFSIGRYEVISRQYAEALNWAARQDPSLISIGTNGKVYERGGTIIPYCDTTEYSDSGHITWNPSTQTFGVVAGKEDHPMVRATWYGAAAYCNWRSLMDGLPTCYDANWACNFAANGYRLPTEAEWEFAARGGVHNPYSRYPWEFNDDLYGWMANYQDSGHPFRGRSPYTTPVGYYNGSQIPAGQDMANEYGLYDMAGNVEEWCNDWYEYDYYESSPEQDPQGGAGSYRVLRGGSWTDSQYYQRCSYRGGDYPDDAANTYGFRVAKRP